jgi:hypothetical protein
MGFLKPAPERTEVEVMQSTHGQTFVTWPTDMTASGGELPALPLGHTHPRSRHWVLADRTAVVILPGDPSIHMGGVIRHTYDVVSASWNSRTKTLTSLLVHPSNPEVSFAVTTSGQGCACTQGPAGNAGPINDPYKIVMVNPNAPEYDWFTLVPA